MKLFGADQDTTPAPVQQEAAAAQQQVSEAQQKQEQEVVRQQTAARQANIASISDLVRRETQQMFRVYGSPGRTRGSLASMARG